VLHDETHGAGFDIGKSVACRRDAPVLLRSVSSKRLVQTTTTFQFEITYRLQHNGRCGAVAFKVSAFCLYIVVTFLCHCENGIDWIVFKWTGLSSV
jgi:hypothetical protein